MAPTFSSLPTEILLEILGHLPRPTLGTRLAAPSALIATALVNKQLRSLSQQLMFDHVRIKGKEQAKSWTRAVARKWTTELWIEVGREDMAEGTDWLAKVFARGLSGKDGNRGRKLEVLEVEGVEEGELKDGWCRAEGLQGEFSPLAPAPARADQARSGRTGLVSLSISFTLPTHFPTPLFPNLRHLRLVNPAPFRPGPPPTLPAVTHLTLGRLPSPQPDWTTCCPSLSDLTALEQKTTANDHLDIAKFAAPFIARPGPGLARASLVILTTEQAGAGPPVRLLASFAVAQAKHELEQNVGRVARVEDSAGQAAGIKGCEWGKGEGCGG